MHGHRIGKFLGFLGDLITYPSSKRLSSEQSTSSLLPHPMVGKTVLITGGTSGIGLATACELAKRGAHVVILCHDAKHGHDALTLVNQAAGTQEAELLISELASLASIRAAAEQFVKTHRRLDVLINNAGVHPTKRHVTVDGYEEIFAVNYLSHFLLTHLLLPLLQASAPSRIINVSSVLYRFGHIDWDDLQLETRFTHGKAYNQSKLAQILFTRELAKRLNTTGVTVNAVHPGLVATNMLRDHTSFQQKSFNLLAVSAEEGAQTSVYLASSNDVEKITGCYFVRKRIHTLSTHATDDANATRLWEVSENLAGIPSTAEKTTPQRKAA